MSAPQKIEREIKKNAIIKGLLLGVVVTALSIFSFYFITGSVQPPLLIVVVMFSCSTVLPIVFSIFFCMDIRKKIGGYWSLRQSVTGIFLMFLISYAILTIGRDVVFVRLIEPDMPKKVEAVMVEMKESRLKEQGAPNDVIQSQISELKKQLDTPAKNTTFDILNGYMETIVLLFAIAIVFGAIFKKEPPYIEKEILVIEE